jgi:large subunit ribosomal protein L7Ae
MPKAAKAKKPAPTPAPYQKKEEAVPTGPVWEKKPKNFAIGGDIQPRRDLSRYVRWPKYVRIQRQRKILYQRLKVPPAINQFTNTLTRDVSINLFKLLHKYRPEDKAQKKERMKELAEKKEAGGDADDRKKTIMIKYGINHITKLCEQKKAQLVVIAHDVEPIEVRSRPGLRTHTRARAARTAQPASASVPPLPALRSRSPASWQLFIWLPAVCRKMDIPYCIVKSKSRLGALVHQKTATALALVSVRPEDRHEFSQMVTAIRQQYNENGKTIERTWGGGVMGVKSVAKTTKMQRAIDKELAKKAMM